MLTSEQRRVLEWIRDNDHTRAGWLLANGKPPRARDDPSKWALMELAGPMGSIRIPAAVQASLCGMTEPAPSERRERLYQLSPAGHAALAAKSE